MRVDPYLMSGIRRGRARGQYLSKLGLDSA